MEYSSILTAAAREGWLDDLVEAHATPCTQDQALTILRSLEMPQAMPIRFASRSGRVGRKHGRYRMSLPQNSGGRFNGLRVGIVIHEAAHILDHLRTQSFGHGPKFQRAFSQALQTNWRDLMPTRSFREIYGRHRGPYSLMLSRQVAEGKKTISKNDHLPGPFSAEEAHEEARMLVTDPRENVTAAFVYSETEGQFIGAVYNRGTEVYRPWAEERAEALAAAGMNDFDAATEQPVPAAPQPAPAAPKVERPMAKAAGTTPTPPKKISRPLTLAEGAEAKWPKSEPNQIILAHFKSEKTTAKDAAEKLGPHLIELGMAHPASAISRLKQNGLLVEVSDAAST